MTTTSLEPTPARTGLPPAARAINLKRQRVGWLFIAPFSVVFVIFLLIPLIYAFWLSIHTESLAFGTELTWFDNYRKAFTDPSFLRGVRRVLLYGIIMVPIQIGIGLVAALVLDEVKTRFAAFSRLMIFLPYAVPVVIGAMMWGFLYSKDFGPAVGLANAVGLDAPNFLSPDHIFAALVNVVTWQWSGYYMIILYSALQSVDPAIYEAAKIDGANSWQTALRIKVPMVSSSVILTVIFSVIGTLQFFNEPTILRNVASGSIQADYTPNMYAYSMAFAYSQFNYASAIAFALGIVVFLCSYLFLYSTRKQNGLS